MTRKLDYELLKFKNSVKNEEQRFQEEIQMVVDKAIDSQIEIIFISGPSGSGKTTVAKLVAKGIKERGKDAIYVTMDDWYLTREKNQLPLNEEGEIDYESPYVLDIELLNKNIDEFTKGKEVHIPKFNFSDQIMEFNGNIRRLEKGGILVVEGIHALNELFKTNHRHLRIFVIPSDAEIQGEFIEQKEIRLYRRISRDMLHRGKTANETIEKMPLVSRGEQKYIYPYKKNLDFEIDTLIGYELLIHKNEIGDIMKLGELEIYSDFTKNDIPEGSLLNEFYR